MDVHVNAAGSEDFTFAGDHFGSWSYNYVDVRLHIGIPRFANRGKAPIPDGDIGLHNSPVVENECVGDDRIDRALAARMLRLAHPVADDFPTTELHLLAVD